MSAPPSSSPSPVGSSNRSLLLIAGAILGLCVCGACGASLSAVFVLPALLGGSVAAQVTTSAQAGAQVQPAATTPSDATRGTPGAVARIPTTVPTVLSRSTPGSSGSTNLAGRWLYTSLTISKPGQPDEVHTNTQTLYLNADGSWELVFYNTDGNNIQFGAGTYQVRPGQLVLANKDGTPPATYSYQLDASGNKITMVTTTATEGTWTIVAERQTQ